MLTTLFGQAKSFDINCTHEVFDNLGQLSVYLFDRFQVGRPTYPPRCDYKRLLNQEHEPPTMLNVVARHFRDSVHHFKHSRDDLLQDICIFTHDFFRDNVRERQDALQPVQKTRRYLIILVLLFQELNGETLPTNVDTPEESTNLKRNVGNTKDSLCNWIQLQGVNTLLVSTWKNGPLRIQPHI